MERYEYRDAIAAFREIQQRAPGWIPGAINLAIALFNDSGVKAEEAKKSGSRAEGDNFDEAVALLYDVLKRDPDNPHAHFSRAIIFEQQGRLADAHRDFRRVTELDPNDAAAWYWTGSTLPEPANTPGNAGALKARIAEQSQKQIEFYTKALELDPYLAPAIYRMAMAARFAWPRAKTDALFARWRKINPDGDPTPGPGNALEKNYGYMGKYAAIVNPFVRPDSAHATPEVAPRLKNAGPLQVALGAGQRWSKPADFTGALAVLGRIRARFGAGVAAFDADGDGRLDLYLAAAVSGPTGIRDALLLNRGDGRFEDASTAYGLPADHASIAVAASDFDADRHIDLFLTGVGNNRLLRNQDGKKFEDITRTLKATAAPTLSLMARWIDLDQDGDLDLYVVNYCAAALAENAFNSKETPPAGVENAVYRNDGQPDPASAQTVPGRAPIATAYGESRSRLGLTVALVPWPNVGALAAGARPHTGIALLDVDNDRDLDLVVTADGAAPVALLNDRLGSFHEAPIQGLAEHEHLSGILTTNLDADGRADLVAPSSSGSMRAWRNVTERTTADKTRIAFETWPANAAHWRSAQALDVDLDGLSDLIGLPAGESKPGDLGLPSWARNEGERLATKPLSLGLENLAADGLLAVDLIGDPLPDVLLVRPGESPALAQNLGNGRHWLVLQLGGHWRVKPELMRTNSHAIGTRVTLEGQGVYVPYDHTTPESGLGQSIAPFILGLGSRERADLVHLRWPDGVMQCELNQAADQMVSLAENNRKTGSCPVLFTWNGRRHECIGDFLGGGGLGYLVAPDVYSQPDRDEAVAISAAQLEADGGVFRLSVTEPMDEVAYLDHLKLDVVDRPPGVSSAPDERFVPIGPRASGALVAWRTAVEPVRATDLDGRDVTEALRNWDRQSVDNFQKRDGWIGYADEHGVILDFGDRLSRYGSSDPLVLCLAGWVEYPFSQTNYAAATAGVALRPPAIERQRDDGRWETIEPHAGYPAGMPRLMIVDLTGKLAGLRCVLRIKTNMECYYDQAFIAVRDRHAEAALCVTVLPVARATLGYRGYTREVSPDGRQPLRYDYDYVDPAPLARLAGKLTRLGDVARLLQADDDQLCVVGPGDEVRLEFEATSLPPLRPGWTRSYVFRAYGYCKDADPFTATSDTIAPLPWRGMPPFPFSAGVKRPDGPGYESYVRAYQTRPAGGGN
jgi:tetratricopeptide (TPR) repeat protein